MFTLKNLLDLKLLPWYQILSGEDCIENVQIEYVCVSELPVGDFIRENELVLSTALGCEENPESMFELVRDVHKSKASALLIALQSDTITLPCSVEIYLREHNFPLILIPWKSRFADITEAVIKHIRRDAISDIAFYETVQKQLLSAYLDSSSANDAAQILADNFRRDVIIFDTEGHPKAFNKGAPTVSYESLQNGLGEDCYFVEIKSSDHLYGSLSLLPNQNSAALHDVLFQRYLMWVLILWFNKEWIIQSTKQNVRDDFVWNLTREVQDKHEDLTAKAEFLGFNLHESYLCIVGKIHLHNLKGTKQIDKWIAANLSQLKEEVIETAHLMHKHIMVTYQKKLLIIYLQSDIGKHGESGADKYLNKLEKRVVSIFPQVQFTWGMSNAGGEPTNFRECFMDAKLALELCLNNCSSVNRFAFKNTIIYKSLSILAADESIKEKTLRIIKPLIEYEEHSDSKLIQTLKIYLNSRNVSEAARSLHLHRQSLLYRLNKIEELTGLSLKSADDLFLLELSIRLFSDMTNSPLAT